MTAQGIVLNLSQISFQIHAQRASSDPVMKYQMGEQVENEVEKQKFSFCVHGQKLQKDEHDTDKHS